LKLAAELTATTRHEPTVYVLDEPTTGLHQGDVMRLIDVLYRLVIGRHAGRHRAPSFGHCLCRARHRARPEGGEEGGRVVAEGTPQKVAKLATATGKVLRRTLAAGG